MKYNKVALIGMPGSGKTSVLNNLKSKIETNYFDTDEIFEKRYYSISDYFKNEGEKKFRTIEESILLEISKFDSFILSTGGGIILSQLNRNLLFNSDIFSIYLEASTESLYKRLAYNTTRPLLENKDKFFKIDNLLKERKKYYTQAHITINTDKTNIDSVANQILKEIL